MTATTTITTSSSSTTTSVLLHLLLLLLIFLQAALCSSSEEYVEGKSSWGDEFCRMRFCAVMSETRQEACCDVYGSCCAYVELRKNTDPFAYLESGEEGVDVVPLSEYTDELSHAEPPKPMRLREEKQDDAKPPSLSLTRHHHHHHHHYRPYAKYPPFPPSPPAIHLLGTGEDLMKTSYNDQMVKNYKELCVSSYCGLMTPSQHKLCCSIYDQCCSYSNFLHHYDPFHLENVGRRR